MKPMHRAAADAEDHDDLLRPGEDLDAEDDEQEADDVEHGGDQELAVVGAGQPVGAPLPADEQEGHRQPGVDRQRRQHVDPHQPDDGVAEALREADDGCRMREL